MRLPRASGKSTVEALLRSGFIVHRIRGSHYILKHVETGTRVTVPYHRGELAPKTLRSILAQAGLGVEEFAKRL